MSTIGWIGLGNMGSRMTANLVRAGHTVQGFDLSERAREQAASVGVRSVNSVAEAVAGADAVFTMLPKGAHVLSVFEGESGIWANADRRTLLIDSSTIDIETSTLLHARSGEAGFSFVDAPVSGGVSGAADGTLAFMLGGDPADCDRAAEFIGPMSGRIFKAGGPAMGISAKIANNMMLMINVVANSEGAQLAERMGLDPKVFWDIVSASSGRSWAQQTWYPQPGVSASSPANNNYEPGFAAELAAKDVGLALAAGAAAGIELPAAEIVGAQLDRLIAEGYGGRDCTLIAKYVDPAGRVAGWDGEDAGRSVA